jgi:hypothetical protein
MKQIYSETEFVLNKCINLVNTPDDVCYIVPWLSNCTNIFFLCFEATEVPVASQEGLHGLHYIVSSTLSSLLISLLAKDFQQVFL